MAEAGHGVVELISDFSPDLDGEFDLGILSHVLEHVREPGELLAEVARVAKAVVVEVPLEANLSARRASRRALSQEVGLALGAQAGPARIREVVEAAGFTQFRRAAETPFNLVFETRP